MAGDIAVPQGVPWIAAAHVRMAWQWSLPSEEEFALSPTASGIRLTKRTAR